MNFKSLINKVIMTALCGSFFTMAFAIEQQPLNQPFHFLLQHGENKQAINQLLNANKIYQAGFSNSALDSQWIAEGPAFLTTQGDSLIIESSFAQPLIERYRANQFEFNPKDLSDYYRHLEEIGQDQFAGDVLKGFYNKKGQFKGGHITVWNKKELPESYMVEIDLEHQSPMGLFLLFFSATGLNQENIFDSTLPARNGVFTDYTAGAIKSYHISTYAPHRGTARLRKNLNGPKQLKEAMDLASLAPDKKYKYRLIKWKNRISLYLNDQLQMDYLDNDKPARQLGGGHVGLRLMAGAKLKISNFELYQLTQNPYLLIQPKQQTVVHNRAQLSKAIEQAVAGSKIVLEDGHYADVQIEISQSGSARQPIEIVARNPGKVILSGKPWLKLTGSYIKLSGLKFANGTRFNNDKYVGKGGNSINKKAPYLVEFLGDHNRLTNCEIDNFDGHHGMWISVEGAYNRIDHCRFTNKMTHGGIVSSSKPPKSGAYHRFDHNYFSRPDIGSDNAEIIRLATGWAYNVDAKMKVEYNIFEQSNGEGEVISDKSSSNTIRYNWFKNNQGHLSLRQGKGTHVYGNWFTRDRKNNAIAYKKSKKRPRGFGIAVRVTDHVIENNHFTGHGPEFISLVNGQPVGYKKPGRPAELARHHTAASNVRIRHNTFDATSTIASIDRRGFTKSRSVLAHDIYFSDNLILTNGQLRLSSDEKHQGISWVNNALVNLSGNSKFPNANSVIALTPGQLGPGNLPKYLLQRYGSHISNQNPVSPDIVGPSWLR